MTLLLLTALPSQGKTLYFSSIPSTGSQWSDVHHHRLEVFLSSNLNIEVKYIPTNSYEESVELFKQGAVQLGWFGGVTGIQAHEAVPNSTVLAQGFEDQYFKSYFIANKDTKLKVSRKFPAQIEGLRLLFGSRYSTSGRLMPEYFIRQQFAGELSAHFKKIGYSGNHSNTIKGVVEGQYDIGVVDYKVWLSALQNKNISESKAYVIWETPPYPDYHWLLSGKSSQLFGDDIAEKVRAAILAMNSEVGLMRIFDRSHFVHAEISDYEILREIMKEIKLLPPKNTKH